MCHQSQPCQVWTGEQHLLLPKGLSRGGSGLNPSTCWSLSFLNPVSPSLPPFPRPFCWAGILLPFYTGPSRVWTVMSSPPCLGPWGLGSSHVHKPRTWRPTHSGWTLLSEVCGHPGSLGFEAVPASSLLFDWLSAFVSHAHSLQLI